ncbi:hypothetical protein NJB1507_40820 [Mycobacterium marinum]|uniref:hypothetical protein n=1 Tax=Mycobacterium marinum TaxID=1781 RepID=UPI0021C3A165|nr:hypothetical protein [Mycobacterium marinum]GJO31545.1 hypothetical protein NJB1507_40820 [Mycobacterium marinum]
MAIHADVLARLDERASRQAADQMVQHFSQAGARAGQEFSTALNTRINIDRAVSEFSAHGQRAARGFSSGFGTELARSIPVVSGFSSAMAGYEAAAGKAGAVAGRAMGMAFTAAATGLIGAAGYTLFKGFERYEAVDAARVRLDALNQSLQSLGKQTFDVGQVIQTVNSVVLDTPFALDKAFNVAVSGISSGVKDIRGYLTTVADAAGAAQQDMADIGIAFQQIINQGRVYQQDLVNRLQNLPIKTWLEDTYKMNAEQVSKAVKDGQIGIEQLMYTIEQHAGGFAKKAGDSIQNTIKNIEFSIARLGANFLGAIFGEPTDDANSLKDALDSVKRHLDDVGVWVNNHREEIHKFFKTAAEVGQNLLKVLGSVAEALGDHPGLVYAGVAAWGAFKALQIASMFTSITTAIGGTTAAVGGLSAALAAVALPAELLMLLPLLKGSAPGTTRETANDKQIAGNLYFQEHGKMPPGYQQWLQGSGQMPSELGPYYHPGQGWPSGGAAGQSTFGGTTLPWRSAPGAPMRVWVPNQGWVEVPSGTDGGPPGLQPGSSKGGPRLPKAPVVPFDMSVPPGIPGMPQTAATYGAETSFLEARHRLAEKRARLNQLEHTANATAEDVLDARNDVLEAQRSQQQAEMRLAEARQNELEKYTKHMRQGADTLGDIGAQLDQDFGISKGLAGIAENITKFLANLAAAPVIGALSGVQMGLGYKPGEAGSGLLAMAAGAGGKYPGLPTGYGGYGGVGYGGMLGIGVPASYGVPSGANIYSGPHTTDTHGALTPRAAALRSLISQMFGVTNIGGYRPPDGFNEHSSGEALDIMVGDNAALGDQINQFLQANAGPLGLEYSLWQQQQWTPGQGPTPMENRGSGTQNHRDHVHARVRPGPLGGGGGGQVAPSGYGTAPTGGGPGWWGSPGSPGGAPGAPGAPGGTGPIPGAPGSPGVPFPGTQSPLVPGGAAPGLPGLGSGAGTPQLGRYPLQGKNVPQSEGISISDGALGLLQQAIPTAISAAGAAGGVFAPGAGAGGAIASAAAQIGIDEINRAINFGGRAIGTLAQGLGETFIPNESPLADFSGGWFGRIAGAVAGVNAQIPNIAGQVSQAVNNATGGQGLPPGLTPEQVAGQPDQRGGNQGNVDQSVTNTNHFYNVPMDNSHDVASTVSMHQTAMNQR